MSGKDGVADLSFAYLITKLLMTFLTRPLGPGLPWRCYETFCGRGTLPLQKILSHMTVDSRKERV